MPKPTTPLCHLAVKFGTDKFVRHNYTQVYYSLFRDRIAEVKSVMEIGIKTGASLRMWEEFFPNAMIYGVDFKKHCLIREGRIRSLLADQSDRTALLEITWATGNNLDLIIDDGSHIPDHQVTSAWTLSPTLARDGIYIVEDVADDSIIERMPLDMSCEKIRTSDGHADSVLLIMRRNPK